MNYKLITQNEELAEYCAAFSNLESISLDTEFKRETTYFPIPCLIQIAGADKTICIDPFKITDFSPLNQLLCDETITKIMHAGRQDIEVFNNLTGCIPNPVFDTQIAAALLGGSSQVGYSSLVKQFFEIELDKSLTRTDWEKRPLSEHELTYAANDVKYLEEIYFIQKNQLIEKDRLNWLKEEIECLFHDNSYEDSLEKVWRKINNNLNLNQTQRNVLFSLNQWREREALSRNRARQFVVSNDILVNIALKSPQNLNQLKLIDKIPSPVLNRYSSQILSIVNDDSSQQLDIPEPESFIRLTPDQKLLLKTLKAEVQEVASELNIEETFLCNKSTLEKLVRGDRGNKLSRGWRHAVIGNKMEKYLNNKST